MKFSSHVCLLWFRPARRLSNASSRVAFRTSAAVTPAKSTKSLRPRTTASLRTAFLRGLEPQDSAVGWVHLRQPKLHRGRIVDDDDVVELAGIGLLGETREGEVELALTVSRRKNDAYRLLGRPCAQRWLPHQ